MRKKTLLLLFVIHLNFLFSADVDDFINHLEKQEKSDLEDFFCDLVFQNQFGYMLEGYKAVSLFYGFTCFRITPQGKDVVLDYPIRGNFLKGLDLWLKYKSNFKINKYIMLEEIHKKENTSIVYIISINKQAFIETVNDHLKTFETILQKKIIAECLLEDICLNGFEKALKNSEILQGILLGYGQHNSELYDRRKNIQKQINQFILKNLSIYDFDLLRQEETYLQNRLNFFDEKFYPVMIPLSPIYFVADLTHPETKSLKAKYQETYKHVSKKYKIGNVFKTSIIRMISN